MEAQEDPALLYDIICRSAPPVEHNEIKRVLGSSLVEENQDLMNELEALTDILNMYEQETGEIKQSKSRSHAFLLPDRDRLLGNIKFFVENIQRAGTPQLGGRPRSTPQAYIPCSTPREQQVIEYVTHELGRERAPPETPRMAGAIRPQSRVGRPATAPANPEPLIAKANVTQMGEVKSELRALVHEENRTLKEKVELMRLQLEDSIDDRDRVLSEEPPTVAEIKGLESKLETMSMQATMPVVPILDKPHQAIPVQPSSPKQANNTISPKKSKTAQAHARIKHKKPLSVHNTSLVLDCSRSSA